MTEELKKPPKYWLELNYCEELFTRFRQNLSPLFSEPIPPFSTRFTGRLESILDSVKQSYEGKYLNKTVIAATTAYFYQLLIGHPFQNGNKRTSILFTHGFLVINGFDFTLSQKELFSLAVEVIENTTNHSYKSVKQAVRFIFEKSIIRR